MDSEHTVVYPRVPAWEQHGQRMERERAMQAVKPRNADEIDLLLRLAEAGITDTEARVSAVVEDAEVELAVIRALNAVRNLPLGEDD